MPNLATPDDVIDAMADMLVEARNPYAHVRLHMGPMRCDACKWDERRDELLEYAETLRHEREQYAREHAETERIEA